MQTSFTKIKVNKTWVILGVAAAIGLLAALGARNYLSSQMAAIEARAKGDTVEVVVAKRNMQKGETLSNDTLAVREIPAAFAHSNALLPKQFDSFEGKALAFGMQGGEMVLWSMLEGKKVPTFSARVESGRRAITVPVDEINSISGLLEPGDLMDLVITVNQRNRKHTAPLLQSVRVMATGQRSVDDPKTGERRNYSTVTLDVTPEQAQAVIVARETGKVTALLRNPSDQKIMDSNGDLNALLDAGSSESAMPEEPETPIRQVPVLYGGRSGKFSAEGLHLGRYIKRSSAPLPEAPTEPASTVPAQVSGAADAR